MRENKPPTETPKPPTQAPPLVERRRARPEFDPVCGATIATDAVLTAAYEGKTYRFCCDACRTRFVDEPARFLVAYVETE